MVCEQREMLTLINRVNHPMIHQISPNTWQIDFDRNVQRLENILRADARDLEKSG